MAYSKTTKKAVEKVAKKKATKKPSKASVEKKGKDTPVEPSKTVKTPSGGSKRYKARPKAVAAVDNRKVSSSYAKSKPAKRHPNIIV